MTGDLHRSLCDSGSAGGHDSEKALVRSLLSSFLTQDLLSGVLGLPERVVGTAVELPEPWRGGVGDVDLLLCDESEAAAAVEVKTIKFGERAFRSHRAAQILGPSGDRARRLGPQDGAPNRLGKLTKGAEQAKSLARIGFSQVYLLAVVLVDSREQNQGRNTYDGLSSEMYRHVDKDAWARLLDPAIGFLVSEWTQPMDRDPSTTGTSGIDLVRPATKSKQVESVSAWVRTLLRDA